MLAEPESAPPVSTAQGDGVTAALRSVFLELDEKRDGSLTVKEIVAACMAGVDTSGDGAADLDGKRFDAALVAKLIKPFDVRGDGALDIPEFFALMTSPKPLHLLPPKKRHSMTAAGGSGVLTTVVAEHERAARRAAEQHWADLLDFRHFMLQLAGTLNFEAKMTATLNAAMESFLLVPRQQQARESGAPRDEGAQANTKQAQLVRRMVEIVHRDTLRKAAAHMPTLNANLLRMHQHAIWRTTLSADVRAMLGDDGDGVYALAHFDQVNLCIAMHHVNLRSDTRAYEGKVVQKVNRLHCEGGVVAATAAAAATPMQIRCTFAIGTNGSKRHAAAAHFNTTFRDESSAFGDNHDNDRLVRVLHMLPLVGGQKSSYVQLVSEMAVEDAARLAKVHSARYKTARSLATPKAEVARRRFLDELPDTALLPMLMAARGDESTGRPCTHFSRFCPPRGSAYDRAVATKAAAKMALLQKQQQHGQEGSGGAAAAATAATKGAMVSLQHGTLLALLRPMTGEQRSAYLRQLLDGYGSVLTRHVRGYLCRGRHKRIVELVGRIGRLWRRALLRMRIFAARAIPSDIEELNSLRDELMRPTAMWKKLSAWAARKLKALMTTLGAGALKLLMKLLGRLSASLANLLVQVLDGLAAPEAWLLLKLCEAMRGQHFGAMRCDCDCERGDMGVNEVLPLDAAGGGCDASGFIHDDAHCRWTCCGRRWSQPRCNHRATRLFLQALDSLALMERRALLALFGAWRVVRSDVGALLGLLMRVLFKVSAAGLTLARLLRLLFGMRAQWLRALLRLVLGLPLALWSSLMQLLEALKTKERARLISLLNGLSVLEKAGMLQLLACLQPGHRLRVMLLMEQVCHAPRPDVPALVALLRRMLQLAPPRPWTSPSAADGEVPLMESTTRFDGEAFLGEARRASGLEGASTGGTGEAPAPSNTPRLVTNGAAKGYKEAARQRRETAAANYAQFTSCLELLERLPHKGCPSKRHKVVYSLLDLPGAGGDDHLSAFGGGGLGFGGSASAIPAKEQACACMSSLEAPHGPLAVSLALGALTWHGLGPDPEHNDYAHQLWHGHERDSAVYFAHCDRTLQVLTESGSLRCPPGGERFVGADLFADDTAEELADGAWCMEPAPEGAVKQRVEEEEEEEEEDESKLELHPRSKATEKKKQRKEGTLKGIDDDEEEEEEEEGEGEEEDEEDEDGGDSLWQGLNNEPHCGSWDDGYSPAPLSDRYRLQLLSLLLALPVPARGALAPLLARLAFASALQSGGVLLLGATTAAHGLHRGGFREAQRKELSIGAARRLMASQCVDIAAFGPLRRILDCVEGAGRAARERFCADLLWLDAAAARSSEVTVGVETPSEDEPPPERARGRRYDGSSEDGGSSGSDEGEGAAAAAGVAMLDEYGMEIAPTPHVMEHLGPWPAHARARALKSFFEAYDADHGAPPLPPSQLPLNMFTQQCTELPSRPRAAYSSLVLGIAEAEAIAAADALVVGEQVTFGAEGVTPEVVEVIPHHPGGRHARRAERRVASSRITARKTLVVQRGLNWGQADGSKGAALVVEAMERRPYLERLRLLRAFMAVRRAGDDAALSTGSGAPHIVDWRLLVNFVEEDKIEALLEDEDVDYEEARKMRNQEHKAVARAECAESASKKPQWFRGCANWWASAFAKD